MGKKILFGIVLLLALYVVVGGITNILINEKFELAEEMPENKVIFDNEEYRNLEHKEASDEYDKMVQFFPLYDKFGTTLSYLLSLMCFGVLGAILRILMGRLKDPKPFKDEKLYSALVLGALMGLLTVVLSELLPEFKFKSGNDKVFFGVALIGGVFTLEVFNWLQTKFSKFLSSEKEANGNGG